jgi:hypothetical protein
MPLTAAPAVDDAERSPDRTARRPAPGGSVLAAPALSLLLGANALIDAG